MSAGAPAPGPAPLSGPPMPGPPGYGPPAQMYGPGPGPPAQPTGEVEHDQAHSLGLSILAVIGGAAVGAKVGGNIATAGAGALAGGALANAFRAYRHFMDGTDEGETEAKISATYALGSAGFGAYLWHKFGEAEKAASLPRLPAAKRDDDDYDDDDADPSDVGIRPVGP